MAVGQAGRASARRLWSCGTVGAMLIRTMRTMHGARPKRFVRRSCQLFDARLDEIVRIRTRCVDHLLLA